MQTSLFSPPPPLAHCKPSDYAPSQRRTHPHISGVAPLCQNTHTTTTTSALAQYMLQFPRGTPNRHLAAYSSVRHTQQQHRTQLAAERSKWNPHNDPHSGGTDPHATLFVARLPYAATEVDLQRAFSAFGSVQHVRVVRGNAKGSRGYGFVVFSDPSACRLAVRETGVHRGVEIMGVRCLVDVERARAAEYFLPRRLGGGLGGRGRRSGRGRGSGSGRNPVAVQHHQYAHPHAHSRRRDDYRPPHREFRGPSRYAQPKAQVEAQGEERRQYRSRTARTGVPPSAERPAMPDY